MSGDALRFDPDWALLDEDADEILLGLLGRDNEPPPRRARRELIPASRDPVEPVFDKAAFLGHMRLLIDLREQHAIWERQEQARREREAIEQEIRREKQEFEKERAALAGLIAGEQAKNAAAAIPKPPPLPQSKLSAPYASAKPAQQHYVYKTPSYVPPPLPSDATLQRLADDALRQLLVARNPLGAPIGSPKLGQWCTSVVYTRDGGLMTEAINNILRELPPHAHLSAFPVPIDKGVFGANATTPHASLRVTITPDGLKIRFDVTWD